MRFKAILWTLALIIYYYYYGPLACSALIWDISPENKPALIIRLAMFALWAIILPLGMLCLFIAGDKVIDNIFKD